MNATSSSSIKMACRARADIGFGARCRHMVSGPGVCSQHKSAELASAPDVILFKCRVNHKWAAKLKLVGVGMMDRDEAAMQARHTAEAEKLGRNPTAIRPTPDSGSPVFGEEGFGKEGEDPVSVSAVLQWLLDGSPYRLTSFHMYQRDKDVQQNMYNLVLKFRSDAEPEAVLELPGAVAEVFTACSWGFVHLWANPTQEDGRVHHTVNLSHRKPGLQPKFHLDFDHGHWNVTPV